MIGNRLRRLKSLLLCFVMIFTIMPIMGAEPVSAASTSKYASKIYIGKGNSTATAIINDGGSYTPKGSDKPTATYKDGVLTLDNYDGEQIEAPGSITVNLIGTNTVNMNIKTKAKQYGVIATVDLTIVGDGTLNINLDNSNYDKTDVECVRAGGQLIVKSDININTKQMGDYTVCGLHGGQGAEVNGCDVTVIDSSTSARRIYGLRVAGGDIYIKNVDFTLKSSNNTVRGISGCNIINIENSTITYQNNGVNGFGIYTNGMDDGTIGIKNSTVDISGGFAGIADYCFSDKTDVAGVSIEDSNIEIDNCERGIISSRRGVKIEDSDATISITNVCISDFYNAPNTNNSTYGVKILGRSIVQLVSSQGPAIQFGNSTLNIAITQGGKLTAKGASQMLVYANGGYNMDLYTQLAKGELIGTAPWGEQNADGSYSLEFIYSDPIIVTWDKDTNKVTWKASGGVINMEGLVNYRVSLYAKNPSIANGEYGSTAIWSGSSGGSQTYEVTIPSGMIVDTMDYKVVVTPRLGGVSASVSGEAERVHTADIGSMNISWDNRDWYTAKWQASVQEDEDVRMLVIIKKYDESSKTYVQVDEKEFATPADGSYDLRALSSADGEGELTEGKYKAEVRLFKGSTENILAKGETADIREVKYLTLSDSGNSDITDKTDVKIRRRGIDGKIDMPITDKKHLLRGDEVTLRVKNLAEGEQLSGWYIKTKKTNSNVSYTENGQEATFKMLVEDVVAYPLFGSNPLESVELVYNRTDAKTDNYINRLGRVKSKLKYDESKLASIDISWQDEDGNTVYNALSQDMDVTKNYIGSVVLTPASGYFFTNDTVVTLADKSSDSNPVTSRALEIKYGTVKDGKYYFNLYFANVPEVTIYGTAVKEAETKVPSYYKFEYDTCDIASDTGIGTLKGARAVAKIGDILFGDSAKIKINGTSYDGGLSWYTAADSQNSVKVYSQNDITLYPIPDTPVLEYPDGTTFHADNENGTTIKLELDDDYRDALAMPDPQMYYQINGGEVKKDSVWAFIEFELKGGSSAEIKVWVENSAEATYTYHGVDIFSEGAYTPILTPSSTDFTDEVTVTIANKLSNATYVYTTDPNDIDKTDASQWTSRKSFPWAGLKLTDSATVCVAEYETDALSKKGYAPNIAKEVYTRVRPGSATLITVNGNVDLTSTKPYLVNGEASATGTLGESGCTAYFNDGKLQLDSYNGGTISAANGSFTIELSGLNVVTGGGIENKNGSTADGYIVIEGDGYLTVNNIASADNTANTSGIYSYAGKVTLRGNANVTVKVDSGLGFASGIYAHGTEILDNASYVADVVSHGSTGSTYGVGIYVALVGSKQADVLINTTGDVVIDNSLSSQGSLVIYNLTGGKNELRNVGMMTLIHKSSRDMSPDLTYDADEFYRSEEKNGDTVTAVYQRGKMPTPSTPVGAGVSGTVTSYGSAEADVTIHLTEQGGTEPAYEKIVKGNTAAYSFENVPAATYVMKVMKANHVAREYTITVGSSDIVQNATICLLGDVNGDGNINGADTNLLYRYVMSYINNFDDYQKKVANVNGDSSINGADTNLLYRYVMGYISSL